MKSGKSKGKDLMVEVINPGSFVCPFCSGINDLLILLENEAAFALYDQYPVSPGHTLIIPKRHCADYFGLTVDEQYTCWMLVNKVKEMIDEKFHPDGYNIGINNREPAGQTVSHVHIHLIPRFKGDVPRPQGGVRGVIPGKKEYV
jgi:diadenosine tetraphosphate (Ap4A) HIT family hydrolase